MGLPEELRPLDHNAPDRQAYEMGFDATGLLQGLRTASLFSVGGGTTTSILDQEQLIAAAREELRKARQPAGRMATKDQAELAGQVMSGGDDGGPSFQERLGQLMHDANALPPHVTLEYRNLCVEADALVGAGNTPSITNTVMNLLKKATCQGGLKTQNFQILKGVSGVLRPGTTTLLLGPPGAGKSVFLQTLSGRLRQGGNTRVSGSIKYNGVDGSEFELRRTVAFVDQLDYHIPNLTVLETCSFSFACQTDVDAAGRFLAETHTVMERLEKEVALAELAQAEEDAEEGKAGIQEQKEDVEEGEKGGWAAGSLSAPQQHGRGVNRAYDPEFVCMMRELVKQQAKPHIILRLLGLTDVADTVIGDSMLRGISGGQRKRVTTAEVLCGPQSVLLMDEISTGLDSATTFSVVQNFVHAAHALSKTFVISLLQPPPEVVRLFDDVLLLTDGRIMYHGPMAEILPFFERQLDLVCPVRKDAGSFLQEVTTAAGQYAYASPALLERKGLTEADRDPMKLLTQPPKVLLTSVADIEDTFWKETQWGRGILDTLDKRPFNPEDGMPGALLTLRYAASWLHLSKLVLKRQFLLNSRDRAFYMARAIQTLVLGLIVGSLFATISPTGVDGRQVMALASLSVQSMAMMSMPQISLVFANKRVFYKQRDNRFFPPASYVLSYVLTQLPQSTIEVTFYAVVVYWIAGLTPTAGNFFSFLAVLWSVSNCTAGFYRLLGYAVPSMIVANACGALMLLFLMITNGFSIVRGSIPVYLVWIYWINPLAWAVRGLVANELGTTRWDVPVPGAVPPITQGQAAADSFDFYLGSGWIWGAVAVAWASLAMYSLLGVVALAVTQPPKPRPTVAEEEQKEEVKRGVFAYLQQKAAQTAGRARKIGHAVSKAKLAPLSQPAVAGNGGMAAAAAAPAADVDSPAAEADAGAAGPVQAAATNGSTGDVLAAAGVGNGAAAAARENAVVPFVPITLVCRNIRYFVNDPSKGMAPGVVKDSDDKEIAGKLELLKGLDISAEPGSLTALMGGSGAGKTTLMDVILGRKTTGLIRGDILVNGHPKEQATWSRVCGYCEQQDVHSAGTTVREALLFSGRLRLDESIGLEVVQQIVDETLEMVDLTGLQHSIVGDPGGAGLSVEQRKRLSIAVELVANPSVVFMDEPTSGLDARAAAIVMRAVKNVSLSKRTVMVTIHQPSMEIFEAFDTLVLLQRGGRLTYFGPLGFESASLTSYLESQPGVEPIRPGYNPATWMLEVTGGSMSTTFKSAGHDFPVLYADSQLKRDNEARMDQLVEEGRRDSQPLSMSSQYACGMWTQRKWLIKKFFVLYWRNPNYNFVRFLMTICIGLVLGLVYFGETGSSASVHSQLSLHLWIVPRAIETFTMAMPSAISMQPAPPCLPPCLPACLLGDIDESGTQVSTVQNIMGLIFTLTIFLGMFNCMTVQPVMGAERAVFYRERSSSYYSPGPYSLATGVVEIPYLLVQATVMVSITYWMVGFAAVAWKFFYFLMLYFFSLTMFTFFGQFLVFVTPNLLLAQLLSAFLNQVYSIFAGFMVPYPAMPQGWKWMNRLSPTTWILYGLTGSQLSDRDDVPMKGFNGQPTTVSAFMEEAFGYEWDMIWWCTLIVFAYCFFYRGVATVMLSYVNFQKR